VFAIEAQELQKRYGTLQVLQGLTLRVASGEVYGLLGPNGAGKSTLIHLLLGLLRPDAGRLAVLGLPPAAACRRVGYLPERVRYHTHCTAREYLHDLGVFSNLRGAALTERCRALLQLTGLAAAADRRLGTYSKGMLQRLGVAQALLHSPDLLLIDEPTSGLDPAGQHELLELLAELRGQGRTILLCTHQLAEVEALCDRVGILRGGRLAAEAPVRDLTAPGGVTIMVKGGALPAGLADTLRALGADVAGGELRLGADDALQARVLRLVLDAGLGIAELQPSGSTLIDLYLRVTNGQPLPASVAPASSKEPA
jgi:ABC-2 type transport system ATP-binding protein